MSFIQPKYPKDDMERLWHALNNENGFTFSPLAATVFIGMILVISVFTLLENYALMETMGRWGIAVPLIVIAGILFCVYKGLSRVKNLRFKKGKNDPLFIRSLMTASIKKNCEAMEKRLKDPSISSTDILYELLLDKILAICAKDCMQFSEIRQKFEQSRMKSTGNTHFDDFFFTHGEFDKNPPQKEIKIVSDAVVRQHSHLNDELEELKQAHRNLFTSMGDYLDLFPPQPKKVEELVATYRFRPPTKDQAMRMVFALDTLDHIKKVRYDRVNSKEKQIYDDIAQTRIPEMGRCIKQYRSAWENLVDANENKRPE